MDPVKSACRVDVAPILKACATLARESWDTDEPNDRDSWREQALKARTCADALANELSRLRELEVKWLRAVEREQYVKAIRGEIWGSGVSGNWPLDNALGAFDEYPELDAPVTKADLERFRKLVR